MGGMEQTNGGSFSQETRMKKILKKYLVRQFAAVFFLCLAAVLAIYVIVDLIENMDGFIDREVPWIQVLLYYLYYIPYILFLILPVATMLATVFSVGNMARHNELVAMKALGISLYQLVSVLLVAGLLVSVAGFLLAEVVVIQSNRKKTVIEIEYLKNQQQRTKDIFRNLKIQEPPDKIISIGTYDRKNERAKMVRIETFAQNTLVHRIDAPEMFWKEGQWEIQSGYERHFIQDREEAVPIDTLMRFTFQFRPRDVLLAQTTPEELSLFELRRFIDRIRQSGQEVNGWMTDYYMRAAFPFSNLFIVLLSVPLAYNRRKQSLTIGFGIALMIIFFYFGLIKLGQTMGHNGSLSPLIAAWIGNSLACVLGCANLVAVRK
jgi:lipopolysaccharide export system permease protein